MQLIDARSLQSTMPSSTSTPVPVTCSMPASELLIAKGWPCCQGCHGHEPIWRHDVTPSCAPSFLGPE